MWLCMKTDDHDNQVAWLGTPAVEKAMGQPSLEKADIAIDQTESNLRDNQAELMTGT